MDQSNGREDKSLINYVTKLASEVLEDRKKTNNIEDLIGKLGSLVKLSGDDEQKPSGPYVDSLIKNLKKIFTYLLDSREMVLFSEIQADSTNVSSNSYKNLLIKLYDSFVGSLVEILKDENNVFSESNRSSALLTLIKFVEEEGKFPFRQMNSNENNETSFPCQVLSRTISSLISSSKFNQELINVYTNYYEYDDFIHFTMKQLIILMETLYSNQMFNEHIVTNLLDFIYPIRLLRPNDLLSKQPEVKIQRKRRKGAKGIRNAFIRLCELKSKGNQPNWIQLPTKKINFDYRRDASIYVQLWMKFLKFPLTNSPYKRTLNYIDKHAIEHFENPLLLADFIVRSFQIGGQISLLSLSPLYVLMAKCNFDYPQFYQRLYELVDSAITYVVYRARFLFWCDLFLTSSHISAAIVSSFIKKIARIALKESPETISILLPFISNLLIRHPVTRSMLTLENGFTPDKDPFLEEEADPEKTNAINSYLWELNTLQKHWFPAIGKQCKVLFAELPKFECNLDDLLEIDLDDLITSSKKEFEKSYWNEDNKKRTLSYDIECDLFNII